MQGVEPLYKNNVKLCFYLSIYFCFIIFMYIMPFASLGMITPAEQEISRGKWAVSVLLVLDLHDMKN